MTDTMVEARPSLFVERCNDSGELIGIVQLDPEYFGALVNVPLLHQVVNAQLAAKRSGTHSTKTRAEVSGGGAKPYRQKGTGRARQGTIRAPQFTGGGIAFGPKPRDYAQSTPRKMVRQALRSALSDRALEGRVCLVDRWSFEAPRTKFAVASLEALGLDGNVLLVMGSEDVVAERCFGNLPHVKIVEAGQLTAYDVVVSDWVVFTDETVPGQVSDAPEGAVAFNSVRPAALELAELGDDELAAEAEELAKSGAGPAAADEGLAEPELAEPAADEELDVSGAEAPDEEEEAPPPEVKPKPRTRTKKPPKAEPADEADDEEEDK
jgi:large subunit ribosomal protein L4